MSMFSLVFLFLSQSMQAQISIGVDDLMPGKFSVQPSDPGQKGEPILMNYTAQGYVVVAAPRPIRTVQIVNQRGVRLFTVAGSDRRILINTEALTAGMYEARVAWEGGITSLYFQVRYPD